MSWDSDAETDTDDTAPCPACGHEIYEDAVRCPACGEYITDEGRSGTKPRWIIWTAALCLLLVVGWILWRL